MTHKVFISYSAKDRGVADTIRTSLEEGGIRCWIAPRDILPGRPYAEAIVEAIETAQYLVLVLSSHANHSQHVLREVERAVMKRVVVIPVRIEAAEMSKSLEYFLSTPQWVDAVGQPLEAVVDRLAESLRMAPTPLQENKDSEPVEPTWGAFLWNTDPS